jgi:glyoxylase I family protein
LHRLRRRRIGLRRQCLGSDEVPSLDTYRDTFAGSGIAPVGGPRIRADNVEQIYLADPDGHIIELLCRLDQPVADQRRAELAASGEGVPVAPTPDAETTRLT